MLPDRSRYTNNPTITVEYDRHGTRVIKTFTNLYASRRFYIAKDKAGKSPTIVSRNKLNATRES
jgi:hypothetical protein